MRMSRKHVEVDDRKIATLVEEILRIFRSTGGYLEPHDCARKREEIDRDGTSRLSPFRRQQDSRQYADCPLNRSNARGCRRERRVCSYTHSDTFVLSPLQNYTRARPHCDRTRLCTCSRSFRSRCDRLLSREQRTLLRCNVLDTTSSADAEAVSTPLERAIAHRYPPSRHRHHYIRGRLFQKHTALLSTFLMQQ